MTEPTHDEIMRLKELTIAANKPNANYSHWSAFKDAASPTAIASLIKAKEDAELVAKAAGGAAVDFMQERDTLQAENTELRAKLEVMGERISREDFEAWLEREMPSGTIIGDAGWWASRIYTRFTAPGAASKPDLIPQDSLFVCEQMGATVTRVTAQLKDGS